VPKDGRFASAVPYLLHPEPDTRFDEKDRRLNEVLYSIRIKARRGLFATEQLVDPGRRAGEAGR
jgi:hypothetical protein